MRRVAGNAVKASRREGRGSRLLEACRPTRLAQNPCRRPGHRQGESTRPSRPPLPLHGIVAVAIRGSRDTRSSLNSPADASPSTGVVHGLAAALGLVGSGILPPADASPSMGVVRGHRRQGEKEKAAGMLPPATAGNEFTLPAATSAKREFLSTDLVESPHMCRISSISSFSTSMIWVMPLISADSLVRAAISSLLICLSENLRLPAINCLSPWANLS